MKLLRLVILIFILLPLFVFAQVKKVVITGEVLDQTTHKFAYILTGNGPGNTAFYKSALKNGAFNFEIPVKLDLTDTVLHAFIFLSKESDMSLNIYRKKVQQREIRTSKFIIDTTSLDLNFNEKKHELIINGGRFNREQRAFTEIEKEYERRFREDDQTEITSQKMNEINDWRIITTARLIREHSTSLLALEHLRGLARLPVPGFTYKYRAYIDTAFKSIAPELQRRPSYLRYLATFEEEVGNSIPRRPEYLPVLSFEDLNGKKRTLSELYPEKKYLVLEFWATWCGPCIQQQPGLEKLAAKYKDAQTGIAGIATDYKKADWINYRKRRKSGYPDVWLTEVSRNIGLKELSITTIPRYIVVETATGKIIEHDLEFEEIESRLKEL